MGTLEQTYYALIDINNCYVSCERLFRPELNQKPVVILSNNDGCVVSRSNEAKAIGIKMAIPWYQIQHDAAFAQVHVLSSNYSLYAEMSRRFFATIHQFFDEKDTEIYSIDECFIQLNRYVSQFDLTQYCEQLARTLEQWLGLPCCIGIGSSKTQAKLANHYAKTVQSFKGVCNLLELDPTVLESLMLTTPVKEVWGVGRKISSRLANYQIYSCFDLIFANEHHLTKAFSVVIARTIRELKGQSCISLDDPDIPSQRIFSSRSFSEKISDLAQIKQALIFHLQRAHRRLVKQQQLCQCIQIFLYEKSPNSPNKMTHSRSVGLAYASDDLLLLSKESLQQLDVLFSKNKKYIKVGIMLCALHLRSQHIDDLLQPHELIQERQKLMLTLGSIQQRFGHDSVQVGYHSCQSEWQMKQHYRSARYLTHWNEILCIDDSHMALYRDM